MVVTLGRQYIQHSTINYCYTLFMTVGTTVQYSSTAINYINISVFSVLLVAVNCIHNLKDTGKLKKRPTEFLSRNKVSWFRAATS